MMTEQTNIHPELVVDALAIVDVRDKVAATDLLAAAQLTADQIVAIAVVDDASFVAAGGALRDLKTISKRLEELRTTMKAPALDAGRRIDAFFRAPSETLAGAEKTLKSRVAAYQAEIDRRRREAEEKARLERERVERERAEAARREAEERAKLSAEEQAERAAADIVAPPVERDPIARPVVLPSAPKLAGVSVTKVRGARVVDPSAVIAAAAAGNADALAILVVDQPKLNAMLKLRGPTLEIPGVELYEADRVSARG